MQIAKLYISNKYRLLQIVIIIIMLLGLLSNYISYRLLKDELDKKPDSAELAAGIEAGNKYEFYSMELSSIEEKMRLLRSSNELSSVARKRSIAKNELQHWQDKTDELYKYILSELSEEDALLLAKEQKEWETDINSTTSQNQEDIKSIRDKSSLYKERADYLLEAYKLLLMQR